MFKDANALYLDDPQRFKERFAAALRGATPYGELRRAEKEAAAREALAGCQDLAQTPNILERFARDLARSGVAGESRVAKLLYLAVTSRFLDRPVSIAVKGPRAAARATSPSGSSASFPRAATMP